jgi:hypothetical protein
VYPTGWRIKWFPPPYMTVIINMRQPLVSTRPSSRCIAALFETLPLVMFAGSSLPDK